VSFHILAPLMFIGIDMLPATMKSRSIIVPVFRKKFKTPPIDIDRLKILASRLLRWTRSNANKFELRPQMPETPRPLDSREEDIWRPIVAIANALGGDWPAMVKDAMWDTFSVRPAFNKHLNLLLDIRRVFDARRVNNAKFPNTISSVDLAAELFDQAHGRILFADLSSADTAREQRLASLLEVWRIRPRRTVVRGYSGADKQGRIRAFERGQFEERWADYGVDAVIAAEEAEEAEEAKDGASTGPATASSQGSEPEGEQDPSSRDFPGFTPSHLYTKDSHTAENGEKFSTESVARESFLYSAGGAKSGKSWEDREEPSQPRVPFLKDVKPVHRRPERWFSLLEVDEYGDPTWFGGREPPGWRAEIAAHVAKVRQLLESGVDPAKIGIAMAEGWKVDDGMEIPPFLRRSPRPNGSGEPT
jgi:hypothetical protein